MHILLCLGEERQQQFHHRLGDTAAGKQRLCNAASQSEEMENDWHRDRQDRHINSMREAMEAWEGRKHMAVTRTMKSARAGLGLKLAKVQDIRKGERMVMNRVCACVGADLAGT